MKTRISLLFAVVSLALTGVAPQAEIPGICRKMLTDRSLTQCSIYFKYYLHQALVKAGLGDNYLDWLDIWRKSLGLEPATCWRW